ncbi:hypothetical protein ACJ73_07353, partial [Blastomyces percursus]
TKEPDCRTEPLENFSVNAISNIHLLSLFIPLMRKSVMKRVITLTSGGVDTEFILRYDITTQMPCAVSKAVMNAATAKFSAQYWKEGILFVSISLGVVVKGVGESFKGLMSIEKSVGAMLGVIERANINNGHAGAFVSHHGNKYWL